MKHNTTNCEPPTRPWDQILINSPYDAPLRPYQVQVAKQTREREGGGAGACREIFSGGEEESPATNDFIMRHEYFPNKELFFTKRMVHIT